MSGRWLQAMLRHGCRLATGSVQPANETKPTLEDAMTAANQALLLTGELFVLSFAAIFAIWFADKLRRNFFGRP
jgi:hypothetical protein